ncbi:hypothetical protein PQX77_007271 [Marasmius sp. AFHP31]|nr:hypothetical protein PQX77_007271 [Marasmius sp. AFHP31]
MAAGVRFRTRTSVTTCDTLLIECRIVERWPVTAPNIPKASRTKRKAESAQPEQTCSSGPMPSSSSPRRASATTEDARKKLLDQYRCIAEKPIPEFLEDHVPCVNDAVVKQVMDKLKGQNRLSWKDKRVADYDTKTPRDKDRAQGPGFQIAGWEQLLCTGEMKKLLTGKTQLDNWAKVLWGMHHIMRNDPCRLFTFGYSMEDDQGRLWYNARSGTFVSKPFNWIEDPEPVVRLVLALTLIKFEHFSPNACNEITFHDRPEAHSSGNGLDWIYRNHPGYLKRIGIDSTMKRVLVDKKIQYEINPIMQSHATGRCTRVWAVYKKGDRNTKFVLKDVWLEEGAKVEGDKLRDLKRRVDECKIERPPVKDWHSKHLLVVHADERLDHEVRGASRHKHDYLHLKSSTGPGYATYSSIHSGSQRSESRGGPSQLEPLKEKPEFDSPNRFHYRIVFEGGMMPLESVPSRREANKVVKGALRVWCIVTLAIGTCIGIPIRRLVGSGISIISLNTDWNYEDCTPHFWSTEVEAGQYLYLRQPEDRASSKEIRLKEKMASRDFAADTDVEGSDDSESEEELGASHATQTDNQSLPSSIFQHNLLHDVESVFWVSLWSYLYLVGPEDRQDCDMASSDDSWKASPVVLTRLKLYEVAFPPNDDVIATTYLRGGFWGSYASQTKDNFVKLIDDINDNRVRKTVRGHYNDLRTMIRRAFGEIERSLTPPLPGTSAESPLPGTSADSNAVCVPYNTEVFTSTVEAVHAQLEEYEKRWFQWLNPASDAALSPLAKHEVVLEQLPGPNDLPRWKDDVEDVESDALEQATLPTNGESSLPPTFKFVPANKRHKGGTK